MSWIIEQLEAAFWIVVGVLMLAFAFSFGEIISGQWKKEKKPNDESH